MKCSKVRIGELGRVVTGKTPSTGQQKFFDGEYPFITPSDLEYDSYRIKTTERTVTEDAKEKFPNQFIPAGAITYTCIASVGKIGIAERESLTNQQINSVIPYDHHDGRFIYYLLRNETQQIQGRCTGVAAPIINKGDFEKVELFVPDRSYENKIADVLSLYDELIENNDRRLELLEDAMRLLYQEWFVCLQFPGHEHIRVISGVPDGWKKVTAFDAMEVLSGGTPKTAVADYWDGEIPFYTPKDSVEQCYVLDTEKHLTETGLECCNSKLYPKDTVFITARGTVGNLNLAQRPMAMNQSCYALVGKEGVLQKYLFCAMRDAVAHFQQNASGAVFDAIIVDTFKRIPFLIPEGRVVEVFEGLVEPMFQQVENLLLQNQKLRDARDILLPRLMSGEIKV